ncbi:BBP7 family outer membrane beta-barrel protein [Stieleria sp. TO1_6]|uniref:BBP7 family outer membrane beta-barrel protein n=1 Tax=Stieleria tagensis TaxID=2956795 RepID=UPI00209BB041|nr:BBP7 family outer membrane beta-barrel protein [Stieleria tagensis]MCO8122757.1 BBP7 family outer membrane beta-barrel protein [Stieleria tagensis]
MIQDAQHRLAFQSCLFTLLTLAGSVTVTAADGQVRHDRSDRGTYQPPVLVKGKIQRVNVAKLQPHEVADGQVGGGLVDAPLGDPQQPPLPQPIVKENLAAAAVDNVAPSSEVQTVGYQQSHVQTCSCESCRSGSDAGTLNVVEQPIYQDGYDVGVYDSGYVDSGYCDSAGCDSMGCDSIGNRCDDWFGSIELMLMFRSGDRPPPLLTTGPASDPDTAGQLGQAGTVVLAGGQTIFKDMVAGGRFTIGSWLDSCKDRSVVARGWFAGEQNYGLTANQDTNPVLTRPFFNVTDGATAEQDTQIVAFPNRATGEIGIYGDSNVYGADISMRQLWSKRYGGTVDLLYGYQYMQLDESLAISSRSTSINDDFAPLGSVIAVSDSFAVENQFHGGQIGFASSYREGCWSFSSLAKVGFGSLTRRADRKGNTFTSIDGNNASDPNGLLVRSTNAGTQKDSTFSWVPELDLTLGWQRFPAFDVTFGYHVIAMTEALQVSGAIDPSLAVNFANTGAASPSPNLSYDTFFVQGIHFGLTYIH